MKYDIKIATEAIIQYINHLMRDVQQKKAKEFAFSKISEMKAFWLRLQSKSISSKVQRRLKGILWQKRNEFAN